VLQRIALLAIAAPRWIVAIAALVVVGAAAFGIPVANSLSAGGFQDPSSESARASQLLKDKFRQSDQQLSIMVSDPAGVNGARARAVGLDIVDRLRQSPYVTDVTSPWTVGSPQAAAPLLSKDATSGLIVAAIGGGENNAQKYAAALSNDLAHDRDGVTVRSGGTAMIIAQANHQTQRDLLLMESIAIPLTFLVLVWVFGGLLAATLPLLRSRGLSALPVTYIGKGATFALMSGFPLVLLGNWDALWSRVIGACGWAFLVWGTYAYLWSFAQYAVQITLVMRDMPKVKHRSSQLNPPKTGDHG